MDPIRADHQLHCTTASTYIQTHCFISNQAQQNVASGESRICWKGRKMMVPASGDVGAQTPAEKSGGEEAKAEM